MSDRVASGVGDRSPPGNVGGLYYIWFTMTKSKFDQYFLAQYSLFLGSIDPYLPRIMCPVPIRLTG